MNRGLLKTRFLFHSLTRRLISVRPAVMSNQSGDDDKCRDHLKRTASTPRLQTLCPVTVSEVSDLSSTVKGITFQISRHYLEELHFKAGQWVDMIIPGVETVGGFSICNSPSDLMKNHRIVLAVKNSEHPPAHWCNTKCRVGDQVQVRVGGNCFYEFDPKQQPRPLLLIGGGVGINPLLSIFMYRSDMYGLHRSGDVPRTHLVLTARKKSELLFENQITSVCESNPAAFTCRFHVTKEQLSTCQPPSSPYRSRRFTPEDMEETISGLTAVDSVSPECYICGPPPFIERCADLATEFGLDKNLVHYEKWW